MKWRLLRDFSIRHFVSMLAWRLLGSFLLFQAPYFDVFHQLPIISPVVESPSTLPLHFVVSPSPAQVELFVLLSPFSAVLEFQNLPQNTVYRYSIFINLTNDFFPFLEHLWSINNFDKPGATPTASVGRDRFVQHGAGGSSAQLSTIHHHEDDVLGDVPLVIVAKSGRLSQCRCGSTVRLHGDFVDKV